MPGVNLNLDLPSLSDTFATIVSKLVTALAAVQTDLTPKITPAQINVNAPLSLSGNALTQVTSLQLAAGNMSASPGSIFYYLGEFWAVDASGTAIQLTANGLINIGGTGGFVGDYVASDPTGASYDLASGQFRFTKSAGVWADLSFANLILNGSAGSVQIGVDAAINTARIFNFKALPAAGISGLVYNAATSTVEDSAVTRETNTHLFTSLHCSADINLQGNFKHAVWKYMLPLAAGVAVTTSGSAPVLGSYGGATWTFGPGTNGNSTLQLMIPLRKYPTAGERVTSITVSASMPVGNSPCRITLNKTVFSSGGFPVTTLQSQQFLGAGTFQTYTMTVSSPVAVGDHEQHWVEIKFGDNLFTAASYTLYGVEVYVDAV